MPTNKTLTATSRFTIKEAFVQDGIPAYKVVSHRDGTYSAGFLHGDPLDHAERIARTYQNVHVVEVGYDLCFDLYFAGTTTPGVRFSVELATTAEAVAS